ncbi:hypothetical protein HK103_004720 [Boothiomyces macroporosus]|uniref:Cation-transporting P-type ATPase N-terminal domain-containing protein n=1 Tax=Boothiomyces macroporosus TaxID=261099 RepID=A0AAD5UMA5_9FUNG|nr:hypothetical protein HK103_004720 [Boothiomyces macroporosus]
MDPVVLQLDPLSSASPNTNEYATIKLIEIADEVLKNNKPVDNSIILLYFKKTFVMVGLGFTVLLFVGYIYTGTSLYEGIWLFLVILLNGWLYAREKDSAAMEMWRRLELVVETMRKHGINYDEDIAFTTNVQTVSLSRVVRNGKLKLIPCNLLVSGDIVLLGVGDRAPTKIELFESKTENQVLDRDQILKQEFFKSPVQQRNLIQQDTRGLFYFKVLETPLLQILESALKSNRPQTMIAQKITMIEYLVNNVLLWVALLVSLAINVVRVFLVSTSSPFAAHMFQMLARYQIIAVLPLLPIALPTLMLISRSYGNAYILTLFDALQSSKTEFEDKEDVDEFDAAPAPTKDFVLSWGAIYRKFYRQLVKKNRSDITRITGLIDAIPAVEQLFFLGDTGDATVLDACYDPASPNGVRFEDDDWNLHLKMLKPVGLLHMLNTECGVLQGKKRNEMHFKSDKISLHGSISHSRKTCTCQFGREIGFTPEIVNKFTKVMVLETFAPSHHSLQESKVDYEFEIPSMLSQIVTDGNDSYQLFAEGTVELVVESCGDYWNGSGLGDMNENIERKIFEFQQNAIINDLQVVAYSYRPIQNSSHWNHIKMMNPNEVYYLSLAATIPETGHILDKETVESPSRMSQPQAPDNSVQKLRKRLDRERALSLVDNDATELLEQDFCIEITKGQTFLCAASFIYPPRPNVIDFVEDLALAGIRFVYFSFAPERESKAYAERLGLEIDWNSCIILSPDNGTGPRYLALHDIQAQLPRGVDNIRNHIENVDDVPLHVSLFAESRPPSIREMTKIFQEHGEVVCVIGSSLNDLNVECFANADISIGIDPIPVARNYVGGKPLSLLCISSQFNSSPCALTLNSDFSFYNITQMIREARSLADNGQQCIALYLGIQLSLSFCVILSYCSTILPPIFTGYQIMFIQWIISPVLSLSLLFTPHHSDIMTHLPAKHLDHWKDVPRFVVYYILRFCIFPAFSCVAQYWL